MVVRLRSSSNPGKGKPKDDEYTKAAAPLVEEVDSEAESEDWCFVCKDGGSLRYCDHPKCDKSYHYECVGKDKSFLASEKDWVCDRHSCSRCMGRPNVTCYCCPRAICNQCLHTAEFVPIGREHGLCKKCISFVLSVEEASKPKAFFEGLDIRKRFLFEYYGIIKKKYGLTVNDIRAAQHRWVSREKCKSSSSLDEICDIRAAQGRWISKEKHKSSSSLDEIDDIRAAALGRWISRDKRKTTLNLDEIDGNKRFKGLQKIKFDSDISSKGEVVISDVPAIRYADLVPENVKLMYLSRSLIKRLLKQPESFEDKVKGTFIPVELPQNRVSNRKAYQLVQVTGVKKTLYNEDYMGIKLRGRNFTNDVSIDMISDADFSENACKDLRQLAKDGLIEKITVVDLEQKAKVLREDMVDDFIDRELRKVQARIDRANEKGWKRDLLDCLNYKKQLETPEERLRLIKNVPGVVEELVDVSAISEEIVNDKQEIEGFPKSIPTDGTLYENVKTASGGQFASIDEINEEGSLNNTVIMKDVLGGSKTTLARSNLKSLPGDSVPVQVRVSKHVQVPVVKPTVPLIIDIEKDLQKQFPDIKNEGIKQFDAYGERTTSDQIHMRQPFRGSISSPWEGRSVPPLHPSPSEVQQPNPRFHSRNGLEINDHFQLDDVPGKLGKEAEVPLDLVSGEHYKNEVPINLVHPLNDKELVLRGETVLHFKKMLELQDGFAATLEKMEANLDRLNSKTEEVACSNALKMASLEEKVDRISEQQTKQKEVQAQSAEEIILSYKKSVMFKRDLLEFLEPFKRMPCAKALEEIKSNHLPDLDLSQFPSCGSCSMEEVHQEILTCQASTEEAKCGQPTVEQQSHSTGPREGPMYMDQVQEILIRF